MPELTEFHRGWMIEVVRAEAGFQFVCCSPMGERLSDSAFYPNQWMTLRTAFQLVDQFYACYALREVLRDTYETGQTAFDEWQQLNQSLEYFSRARFMKSPS